MSRRRPSVRSRSSAGSSSSSSRALIGKMPLSAMSNGVFVSHAVIHRSRANVSIFTDRKDTSVRRRNRSPGRDTVREVAGRLRVGADLACQTHRFRPFGEATSKWSGSRLSWRVSFPPWFFTRGCWRFSTRRAAPRAPYSMDSTPPLGIPAVLSLAFWGGVWGMLLWFVIAGAQGLPRYWLLALLFGAVAPSLIALLVVLPLKGQPLGGGWRPAFVIGALLLNGAWGLGVAAFMRLFQRPQA